MTEWEQDNALGTDVLTWRKEVGTRLRDIESDVGGRVAAAKYAGVSKSAYERWVYGTNSPSLDGIARLARATGRSIDWIAFGDGEPRGDADGLRFEELAGVVANQLESIGWSVRPTEFVRLTRLIAQLVGEIPAEQRGEAVRRALKVIEKQE